MIHRRFIHPLFPASLPAYFFLLEILRLADTEGMYRINITFHDCNFSRDNLEYAFSEFATPSCKWDKVTCLQCKSYKVGPLVWGTTCNVMAHVCLFVITRPLVHHKNKSNRLETRLWEDILHQTIRSNSYGKI